MLDAGYASIQFMLLLSLVVMTPARTWGQESSESAEKAIVTNSIDMKLVLIPAGKFMMGSPLSEMDRLPEEVPHEVTITRDFLMGVYEVTQGQFQQVMGEQVNARFAGRGDEDNLPMEMVTWQEANAFCDKLTQLPDELAAQHEYRLPTEAEWEYACRGGTATAFAFGDSLSSRDANFNGNHPYGSAQKGPYSRRTVRVGSFAANQFGLHDMHGNVSEWCADWYDPEYYRDSPTHDPLGPAAGALPTGFGHHQIVIRGGSWLDEGRACRAAYRFRAMPENRYEVIGFRVVCEIANSSAAE